LIDKSVVPDSKLKEVCKLSVYFWGCKFFLNGLNYEP
jgi:hypothetical protein